MAVNIEKRKRYLRNYRQTHRSAILEKLKLSKSLEPERFAAYQKRYQETHRAVILAKRKAYYYANLEIERAKRRDSYAKHPESRRKYCAKRRAKLAGASIGDLEVIRKWEAAWRKKTQVKCYWCKLLVPVKTCHTDHIVPLSKGGAHVVENLCIACEGCNVSKGAKILPAWNSSIREPILL